MKNKYTVITICVALAIVIAGYFSLSLMTNGFIEAGADIYEETDNSDEMQTAANELISRCAYPLIEAKSREATDIPESDKKYYLGDTDPVGMIYKVASTANQSIIPDKAFQKNYIYTNDQYLVIDATVNDGEYKITTAYNYGELYGFYCRPAVAPSEEQIKTAVEDLQIIIEKDDQGLESFLNSVESLNDDNTEYASGLAYEATRLLYLMMQAEGKFSTSDMVEDFYNEDYSLNDCYKYGSKLILTNGKEVLLLSSVRNCGIAVFYDAINKKFSGINLLWGYN